MTPGQAAPVSNGRAAYRAYAESFLNVDVPGWNYLPDQERAAWEAAAQAAIAAAPACPCGGMPGTACGDLIVALRTVVAGVRALCMDTDGGWLLGEEQLPVGEFQAVLARAGLEA